MLVKGHLLLFAACLMLLFARGSGDFLVPSASASAQVPLTASESHGKQLYFQGTSALGTEIIASLGETDLEVPGSTLACAGCHGRNGVGQAESGVDPLNLNWEALTKAFTHADGRRRPAYDERSLELAITRGTDPAGKKLLNVMPRYRMSREDVADLIAYLKRVGTDFDPGLSESKIVIGGAVPATGTLAPMGQAVKAVTTAYFDELNSHGGIYGRRIELKFAETGDTPAATRANLARLIKDEQVFAMTGAFLAGADREIAQLMAEQAVPLIGPLTLFPQTTGPLNRQVFYLLSGIDGQARALVNFVAGKSELKNNSLAVVYPRSEINEGSLVAIRDQSKTAGLKVSEVLDYAAGGFDAAGTVKRLKQSAPDSAVFFLGGTDDLLSFMGEAEKLSWFPTFLLPSAFVGAGAFNAPAGFDGKLFFSFPTSPADQTADGIKEFAALSEKYKLSSKNVAAQISAYSAAKILGEALRRAGKDVSRQKLIQILEGFNNYSTGLTPAITYAPNRRLGAMGAYIVRANLKEKQFAPASGWVAIQ